MALDNPNDKIYAATAANDATITNLAVITYTIPANAAEDTYPVGIEEFRVGNQYDVWLASGIPVSATLTIEKAAEETPTDPYTADLSTTNNTVVNGQDVVVNVDVDGTVGSFNSAQVVVKYDPEYLTYKSAATTSNDQQAPDFEVDTDAGTVTIRDYGAAISNADGIYALTFTAAKGGNTTVEIPDESAGFSTAAKAETEDLTPATIGDALALTINHKVTVNGEDVSSVAPNGTYEYTISGYDATNNTYDITVTVGGSEVAVTPDKNGKITVTGVTGDLVISYTVTANQYIVTWVDSAGVITNKNPDTATVTHGTSITFDVPANLAPKGLTPGHKYVVKVTETADASKTITATSADNSNGGLTYTINGNLIEADITITVTKEAVAATHVTVTINGEDIEATVDGNALESPATVAKGSNVVLTLTPETGYTYTVKVGDTDVTSGILDDNMYTIENIQSSVTVTVTKKLTAVTVTVQEYLTLDETKMWLVTINDVAQIENKTYSYNGGNMFWSSKYNNGNGAYCYLVIADNLSVEDATAAIGSDLVDEAAVAVDYGMDVNKSGTMDVNDAQLVWNMYNATASAFTTNVTMEKFLRADVNDTVGISSMDAAAIIDAIKNPTGTTN